MARKQALAPTQALAAHTAAKKPPSNDIPVFEQVHELLRLCLCEPNNEPEGPKATPKRATASKNRKEHVVSFQESEGKRLIRWAQCKLILPWSQSFEDVERALTALLGIKVARGKAYSFMSSDEEELDGGAELRDVMSDLSPENFGAPRTVIVCIKLA
ncbi:hypothetical protein CspeluHIS016_0406770 [Cutaneotrichosporon spelunceum]|uniref:PB1 domain-containing protein n=1 Tax=Cutaneotrichosporon spelunceum TaxID=1672016 RepID=A0AAD3TW65_9TREE|nr:hypothetical protein CspeluHIS016_0406770 [Cutaneotrichosporon spelunceum]